MAPRNVQGLVRITKVATIIGLIAAAVQRLPVSCVRLNLPSIHVNKTADQISPSPRMNRPCMFTQMHMIGTSHHRRFGFAPLRTDSMSAMVSVRKSSVKLSGLARTRPAIISRKTTPLAISHHGGRSRRKCHANTNTVSTPSEALRIESARSCSCLLGSARRCA